MIAHKVVFISLLLIQLSGFIDSSIILSIVNATRNRPESASNEIIHEKNINLKPEFDAIQVPEDFFSETSAESYQPPEDILKLIYFNHNRLVKNLSSLESEPSDTDTLHHFKKNHTISNLDMSLTIVY